ncbi:MAG: cysteine--tRNA ligase, partial [Desulfopila sp.]
PADLLHCRRFVVTDLITRYMEARGVTVKSFMNFTDLDDNTIQGAEQAGQPLGDFTENYIQGFLADIETLGVKHATGYPRASEHVEDMLGMARELMDKGYAY